MAVTEQQQQAPAPSASAPTGRRKVYAWILLAALAAGAVVVRVALDEDPKPATQAVTLRGFAYADAPLRDATLSIQTPDGDAVGQPLPRETKALGSFVVHTALAPDFRVTLSNGTMGEQVFTGRLVADVTGFGPSSRAIHVTPLTTLLAAYQDRHPDLSSARAQTAVRRFLKVPAQLEITGDLIGHEQVFSSTEFVRQAAAAGGIQPFITSLVAEMDARPAKTHPFTGAAQNDFIPTPEEAVLKIVDTVVSKLASTGLSHVLESIGLSQVPDAAELKLLAEVQKQLNILQTSVNDISQKLDQESYDKWALQTFKIKNVVVGNMEDLRIAADNGDKALAQRVSESIQLNLTDARAMKTLHDALTGPSSTTGAYRAWSNLLKSKNPFWRWTNTEALFQYFDYYKVIQADLLYLLGEQAKLDGVKPESFKAGDLKNYTNYQAQQQALRDSITPALDTRIIDSRTNLMWAYNNLDREDADWISGERVQDIIAQQNGAKCGVVPYQSGSGCQLVGFPPAGPAPLYGFRDWRLPTSAEFTALIVGRTGSTKTWLREVWGPDAMRICPYAWSRGTCTVNSSNLWASNERQTSCGYEHAVLNIDTGKQGWACPSTRGLVFPVRPVTPAEKYWL